MDTELKLVNANAPPLNDAQRVSEGLLARLYGFQRQSPLELKQAAKLLQGLPAKYVNDIAKQLAHSGRAELALQLLDTSLPQREYEPSLHHVWAWLHWQHGSPERAQVILEALMQRSPDNQQGALLLANVRRADGRLLAATSLLRNYALRAKDNTGALREVAQFLADSRRPVEVLAVCEQVLQRIPDPAKLAVAAQQCLELGRFADARRHAEAALAAGIDANLHFMPRLLSMTQTYGDHQHPDLTRLACYTRSLERPHARASAHFALGKAFDDLGNLALASTQFTKANQLLNDQAADAVRRWQSIEHICMNASPLTPLAASGSAPIPVFIVGLPRSGSTLLASRLAQHPAIRDRGELPTMDYLQRQLQAAGALMPARLEQAAALYMRHLMLDEPAVGWYLDKAPMNFAQLGLIHALFPQARVLWCRRDIQDTALSIWMQHFSPGPLDYAYDWQAIHAVSQGCQRLMAHWRERLPGLALHEVNYEDLVTQPQATLTAAWEFIGAPALAHTSEHFEGGIGTSSSWQVRQPIHTRSVGRAQAYLPFMPELARFASAHPATAASPD